MGDAEALTGSILAGKYVVERVIGHGGMGAVYLAENTQIGRKVAIKVLHAELAADEQALARFRMEARAAAAIGHPGIVDVLDMGRTDDGSEFIVMELLAGETLGKRIAREGAMRAGVAVPIVCDMLDALAAAHDKGIIHRDLKPENVFLVEAPVVGTKILDFGVSKFRGSEDLLLTQTGAIMGTPLYMSPEQARGAREVTHLADIYAAGAILYEALCGVPPYRGDNYNEVISNVLLETHPPVASLRSDLPAELCAIVEAMLAKDPADRPQHALIAQGQLRAALGAVETALEKRPQAATGPAASIPPYAPTRPQAAAPQPVRARRAIWAGASVAIVIAGAGVALIALRPAVKPAPPVAATVAPAVAPPDAALAPPAVTAPSAPPNVAVPPPTVSAPPTVVPPKPKPHKPPPGPTGPTHRLEIDKNSPFQ